ncbi:MAG: DUF2190 family protein, partial [Alphaproteobacteria bacterium]|nr:DUF2190 family protein [Alphaproteobacteria bacterium]
PECGYSLPAAADLSASQYCFVTINSSGKVALAGAAVSNVVGLLQNQPLTDEQARYEWGGTRKVKAAGTVAAGAYVTSNAAGKAIATTTAADPFYGIAVESAVTGDVFRIHWFPGILPA